jgi:acetyltransferase-like isoleucine patch superfamily enzyme
MPLNIIGDLTQNDVRIEPNFREKSNGSITMRGTGNVVHIATSRPARGGVTIVMTSNDRFELHENAAIAEILVFLKDGSTAIFGANSFAIASVKLFSHERANINIGKDCLIGGNFQCMTSDMHSIVEVATKNRINPPGDIIVGDKVWAGFDVTLMKGTTIGSGSVIGARSTVMGTFPENCSLLGYPARAVKLGVTWDADTLPWADRGETPKKVALY